jgi:phosphoribosylaminoimidazole carboxylase PurE protein
MADAQFLVGIVMGSASDWPSLEAAASLLRDWGIGVEVSVASAHRSPQRAQAYAREAADRGLKIIIAAAGAAAHLAGVLAAETILPVIGVPLPSSSLQGLDSLLSTVQMPAGVPVATMALGPAGAMNAALLAAQILALSDPQLTEKLKQHKKDLENRVARQNDNIPAEFHPQK